MTSTPKTGLIAIVGRPNVGKSTLLNALVGQSLSIVSRKPQTTRYRVQGIRTDGDVQLVFVDTPGWERQVRDRINRSMNREITSALTGVDVAVVVVDGRRLAAEDRAILAEVAALDVPVVLVVNKVNLVKDKSSLLPLMAEASALANASAVVPMSARGFDGGDVLVDELSRLVPEGPHLFAPDEITTQSSRFFVAEILREKLMRQLGDEVPYSSSVIVDLFEEDEQGAHIAATIWVERDGQKAIVIGAGGETLKRIGSAARRDIESLLGCKVFLQTWVKVRENWRNDVQALRQLGYDA